MTVALRCGVAGLLAALALTACAGSGWTYVSNSDLGVYFKIPQDWTLFDAEDLAAEADADSPPTQSQQWVIAFDAAPDASLEHLLSGDNVHPAGLARAKALSDEQRDDYSLSSLRNELVPLDQLAQIPGAVEVVSSEDLTLRDGLRGEHAVFNLRSGDGTYTLSQTALVDADTRNVYVLAIGCVSDCYERNSDEIRQVTDSWTVEEQ